MSTSSAQAPAAPTWSSDVAPPQWANALVADAEIVVEQGFESRTNGRFSLISARIAAARRLDARQLDEAVHRVYMRIAALLAAAPANHPVRFWNHICGIHDPMGAGLDRYMAFNIGRHRAFCDWFGGEAEFGRCIATASGVGCAGDEIVIHALATDRAGVAIANPRQVQPFEYSKRFGPRPPCFARATIVATPASPHTVLIGGTAAIRGEHSVCIGDLAGQLDETFQNLDALVLHAAKRVDCRGSLHDVADLRIYVVDASARSTIAQAVSRTMPNAASVEWIQADLCRADLLVEIEGCAMLSQPAHP